MKNDKTLGIILLVVAVVIALATGFIDLDSTLRIILYIVVAALAIWAIMMLLKKGTHTGHSGTHI